METLKELFDQLIPENYDGITITAQDSSKAASEQEAEIIFDKARLRLSDVNNWFALNDALGAEFMLTDKKGRLLEERTARPGLLIRIDIPGPGNDAGNGYDWVIIEEAEDMLEKDVAGFGIRVRPVAPPGNTEGDIAHFYDEQATSSFIVYRSGTRVKAMVVDRNTRINTGSGGIVDKIRNALVGAGAIALFSKVQWKHLCRSLLQ